MLVLRPVEEHPWDRPPDCPTNCKLFGFSLEHWVTLKPESAKLVGRYRKKNSAAQWSPGIIDTVDVVLLQRKPIWQASYLPAGFARTVSHLLRAIKLASGGENAAA